LNIRCGSVASCGVNILTAVFLNDHWISGRHAIRNLPYVRPATGVASMLDKSHRI
jgi:hypothetical protein